MSVPHDYLGKLEKSLRRHNLHLNEGAKKAFSTVPRQNFVGEYTKLAYEDQPLSIPANQTISAPHMYAMMTAVEIGDLHKGQSILEIGTGSGYGAALLSQIVMPGRVISIERHKKLVDFAKSNIASVDNLDFSNLEIIHGDGTKISFELKFDRILVTASGPEIPPSYLEHLKDGGKIIMPLEKEVDQWLCVINYKNGKVEIDWKFRVRFVPLIGEYGH